MKKIIVFWQVIFDIYINSLKESGKKENYEKEIIYCFVIYFSL